MSRPLVSDEFLKPYQVRDETKCWWCGAKATTREHKFKRSDLARMWDGDAPHLMHWSGDPPYSKVRSPAKSPQVRFKKTLCAPCNNTRSQPFDRAWDNFAEFVWSSRRMLRSTRYLNASHLFGADWLPGLKNVARYVVKHAGCRLADMGLSVPDDFAAFLDGTRDPAHFQMVLFRDRDRYEDLAKGDAGSYESGGLFIGGGAAWFSRSRPEINMYGSTITVGCAGVYYRWDNSQPRSDPFYRYKRPRLHWLHDLPDSGDLRP